MQDTLVQRLRDRAYSSKVPDTLVEEAANEIERLRGYRDMAEADRDVAMLAAERLTLTDEERAALHWFAHYGLPEHRAAALRGLLERLA
jgi:tellurite resistance protein